MIFLAGNNDTEFARAVLPRVEAQHQWWYQWRDHDQNGLAEFGSSDGTRTALGWESGMDNALRFEHTDQLRNGANAWSGMQENVDLNSFLYAEKRALAELFAATGDSAKAQSYASAAAQLKAAMQQRLYDPSRGWYFDRQLGANGSFVGPMACEGFAALWAGVASADQVQQRR